MGFVPLDAIYLKPAGINDQNHQMLVLAYAQNVFTTYISPSV
jgi:hypothetical protein